MIGVGLPTPGQAVFDLDFHTVMHWTSDSALESTTSPNAPSGPGRY
jgi:hypothetical protein